MGILMFGLDLRITSLCRNLPTFIFSSYEHSQVRQHQRNWGCFSSSGVIRHDEAPRNVHVISSIQDLSVTGLNINLKNNFLDCQARTIWKICVHYRGGGEGGGGRRLATYERWLVTNNHKSLDSGQSITPPVTTASLFPRKSWHFRVVRFVMSIGIWNITGWEIPFWGEIGEWRNRLDYLAIISPLPATVSEHNLQCELVWRSE